MSQPKVSIIIPTCNRGDLLARALDSVIAQTVSQWEIVLVDDGSTDSTHKLADRYARRLGDRFQYHYQRNAGASAARNVGIEQSRGEFIAFLDSDDEFLSDKLERQLTLFESEPSLGLVYSDYAYIDLQGQRVHSVFDTLCPEARQVPHRRIEPTMCVCLKSLFDSLLRKYFVSTITGMVRRSVLGDIRWPVGVKYAEEWLFYLQVSRLCEAGFVDEPLCLHHHTEGSMSRTDKARNVRERYRTIRAMREMFPDLSRDNQRVVRKHHTDALIQVAYDQARTGKGDEACKILYRTFRREPNLRLALTLCRLAGSILVEMCEPEGRGKDEHRMLARMAKPGTATSFGHSPASEGEGVSLW